MCVIGTFSYATQNVLTTDGVIRSENFFPEGNAGHWQHHTFRFFVRQVPEGLIPQREIGVYPSMA